MENIIRDSSHLATVLRACRKARAITQADAGKRVGLQQKTVSRLESEQLGSCTVDSLLKLITALELDLVIRPKGHDASSTRGEW